MSKRFFSLVTAVFFLFLPPLLSAGPLSALESQLDWIEMNFWTRLFTRSSQLSVPLNRFLSECRTVQEKARGRVDLTTPAMTLKQIASSTTLRLRGFNVSFKKTGFPEFYRSRKFSSGGEKKDFRRIDPEQYQEFLNETINSNLELFKRRYEDTGSTSAKNRRNSSGKLSRQQFTQLYGKMEIYFQTIRSLREEMLKLRPESGREEKAPKTKTKNKQKR